MKQQQLAIYLLIQFNRKSDSELISREVNRPSIDQLIFLCINQIHTKSVLVIDSLFMLAVKLIKGYLGFQVSGAAINPIFEKYVRDDGTIFYPNAGIIDVEGSTVEEIRFELTSKLSNVLNNPQV